MDWSGLQNRLSVEFLLEFANAFGFFLFVLFFGYILGDRIVPRLLTFLFPDKIQFSHPICKAGRGIIRSFFFLFASFLFLELLNITEPWGKFVFSGYRILSIVLLTFSLVRLFSSVSETYSEKKKGTISFAANIGNVVRVTLVVVSILLVYPKFRSVTEITLAPVRADLGPLRNEEFVSIEAAIRNRIAVGIPEPLAYLTPRLSEGAGHVDLHKHSRKEYETRILNFLNAHTKSEKSVRP
ncbi:hypothetical protein EHQ12_04860 [Leptospira gomenensis]|uniref:Uncharacterized protein n=1 Tax=Leptospira gomenensis TaxID=2484974 RepID=A0A5F1YIB6_9LEPT|nr:hypothetical protein [Leptospira gomenensis]TGK34535.1 hypothetical protein EHQ17_08915 [Leptospira gomenensis]TGK40155.1 hypothetical protein EHQ07_18985 [Leptospira gomenensis]TGK42684.1 hypothetical protein EHQ12_04860 [Leptospira gomenensis]TGK55664.1 hypothetical protein EHQ13_17210 [Leptospira gomenensis]